MKTHTSKTRVFLAGVALAALATSPLARADYSNTVATQGPVGYWRLNETTQPPANVVAANAGSLGSSANGIYSNFPTRGVTGPFTGSKAVGLDGAAQSVDVPWQAGLATSPFTFEIWANPAQVPKFAYLASSAHLATTRSGWYLAQDDGGTFQSGNAFVVRMFYTNGTTPCIQLSATNDLPLGSWYHLVLTFDGTTATLYKNGVVAQSGTPLANAAGLRFVPNADSLTSIGMRSDNSFWWPGQVAEVAMYNTALSAARVSAHYTTANTAPASYGSTVSADAPTVFWRFTEAADPPAVNSGTLGAAGNGLYISDAKPGVAGPTPPTFPGLEAGNKAVAFDAGGGVVRLPPLNLNTNTVTISCWLNATGTQAAATGLVLTHSGSSESGLTIDQQGAGLGLGYIWNGNNYGWSPAGDTGLPLLPDSAWAFAALVVEPTKATLYTCDANYVNFASANDVLLNPIHATAAFDTATLIGAEAGFPTRTFNGAIDEVAIFNRALSAGELYTQYATAVGGVPPKIFTDLQGPTDPVPVGDPIVLSIDAGGSPDLTYTWHFNSATIATTSSGVLTIPSTLTNTGSYDVTVSNGSGSAPSQSVSVTVITPTAPVITASQGFLNRTLYVGATLKLAVTATGGGLKYQWYKNTSPISAATASAYIIASVTNNDAGSYSVSITNTINHASNGPVVITIPVVAANTYAGLIITSKPESWWRLNETGGSTNMFDGMGRHDGYYTNINGSGPLPGMGAPGISTGGDTALSFSASGGVGYVPFSAALNRSQGYTYEAWVKTTALGAYQVPFSSADAAAGTWWAMVTGTTPVTWEPAGAGGYHDIWNALDPTPHSFTTLPTASGVWTHLVLVYDPVTLVGFPWKMYVNGNTDDGYYFSFPPNTINTSGPFVIGCAANPGPLAGSFFNGQVDEVAVYGRVLGLTEITNHFSAGFPSTPPTFSTPFLPQTVIVGKTVSFSTAVQGTTPIALQWYKGSTALSGATSNAFYITSTAVTDTGTYTLWATNSAGTASQSVSLTVILPPAYANVTNGLVLHMRFDGDTTDTSGRANNGTPVNSPAFVTGLIGSQALQYTTTCVTNTSPTTNVTVSSTSYVTLGSPTDLRFDASTSFTISLWVKQPAGFSGGDLPFIGTGVGSMNNPGWDLGPTYGGGGWQWCLNDGVAANPTTNNIDVNGASGSINDGNWHSFVLAVDRTTGVANTYLDGVLVAQGNVTGLGSIDNGASITIGQDPTGAYPNLPTGASINDTTVWGPTQTTALDDLGIWRRALTAVEVAKLQSAGVNGGNSFDTVAPPVTVTVTRVGASLMLSWTAGTLLQSDSVGSDAVWTPVQGAVAPSYTFTPAGASKYYRVFLQ